MRLISEDTEEVVLELESGVQFQVSSVDKNFVLRNDWCCFDGDIYCISGQGQGQKLSVLIAKRAGII